MLTRVPINRDNLPAVLRLTVAPQQQDLVAPNAVTLAEAAYEPASAVWALCDGDMPVGLIALIDMGTYPHRDPNDDPRSAYLWRLMIDAAHQGKGAGRFAIEQAAQIARDWGRDRLTTSIVIAEKSAHGFYTRMGFTLTDRMIDGEQVLTLDL